MTILLTGANGQLGRHLQTQAPADVALVALGSQELDITDVTQVRAAVQQHRPAVIINAAAYTQVDKAESDRERAFAVNERGVANLIAATDDGTRLLHVSTDFVFDGSANQPYATDAPTNPLGVYGSSKLAGERVLLQNAPHRSSIVRTAWLYSAGGKNFMDTMLKLMQTRDSLRVVADQRGTPTSCIGLAAALWRLVQLPTLTGILHWTDDGETTWHGFACEIQRLALQYGLLDRQVPIQAIATHEYPTPARRPAYSVLDKASTFAALGLRAQPWQQALETVIIERKRLTT
ncbi:MAG TPA: dTDP-4-dehydrorhamnose reductase [Candidatus Acidoferrum sp.]|nr:dTDP-4-dehydrorhamnose reductase [Candidatus Acidoferrum sp.]